MSARGKLGWFMPSLFEGIDQATLARYLPSRFRSAMRIGEIVRVELLARKRRRWPLRGRFLARWAWPRPGPSPTMRLSRAAFWTGSVAAPSKVKPLITVLMTIPRFTKH
jgi:hypothetical protein